MFCFASFGYAMYLIQFILSIFKRYPGQLPLHQGNRDSHSATAKTSQQVIRTPKQCVSFVEWGVSTWLKYMHMYFDKRNSYTISSSAMFSYLLMMYINADRKSEMYSSETSQLGWMGFYIWPAKSQPMREDITYVAISHIGKVTPHKALICYYAPVFIFLVPLMITNRKVSANQVKWPPISDLITCTLLLEIITEITSQSPTMGRHSLANGIQCVARFAVNWHCV